MNALLVRSILTALARLGVHEVCVAAGARNAPIITALLASEGVKLWHFFEERCAAFFALGRVMADRTPVAVITTSGTAAAELLPAVIEAHYQGLPLIVITADRPRRFRGTGAPQTIEQPGLFGPYVSASIDLAPGASISWPTRVGHQPFHVNVCLDEPLDTADHGIDFDAIPTNKSSGHPSAAAKLKCSAALPTVVLAGGLHPQEARDLAPWLASLELPIVAEATSNLWSEPSLADWLVAGNEKLLAAMNPFQVIRVGGVPSWTWWRELEKRPEISVVNLSRLTFPGLARTESVSTTQWGTLPPAPLKPLRPVAVTAKTARDLQAELDAHPHSDPAWMRAVARVLPEEARVMLGNSLPIREFNLVCTTQDLAPDIEFFANRGANGIDGLVSTFFGLSACSRESWLILGDLSALYDLAGPWVLSQMPRANRRIVVINNGGGKIFARVPSLRGLSENARIVIENQHSLSFKPWAQLWHMDYHHVTKPEQLNDLPDGPILLEIRPDARHTDAFYRAG